jgi:phosphonate transport system substrate-binding protein
MDARLLFIVIGCSILSSCITEPRVNVNLSEREKISHEDSVSKNHSKIGVAAMLSPKEALPAYEEIVKYIGTKTGHEMDMLFTKDYATMNSLIKKKQVVAAFVCSGPYVKGHDQWGMELVVAPSLHGQPSYYSYIITNKNNTINNLEDLKNKKFAFTDPESNTGKLVPTFEILKMGIKPEKFFSEIVYTGSHDKSVEAVANKLVDGAAVDHLIWEYMNDQDSTFTSKTKIIAHFGPFASPPFVTHPDCDPEFKTAIKSILLNMHLDPDGKEILNKLLIDQFVVIHDSSYQSVRNMQSWIINQKLK